jgi:hypothetical protein
MKTLFRWLVALSVWGGGILAAGATVLNQYAIQDLNGLSDNDVEYQTTADLRIKSSSDSGIYNRKILFLFDLQNFGGKDLTDQYIHSASLRITAADSRCEGRTYRLYGFTDSSSGNNDSSWHEGIVAQTDPNWPVRYSGSDQYPSGSGVKWLDTRTGPAQNTSVTFGGDLVKQLRWGVGRDSDPPFGQSSSNPDGRITLLLAQVDHASSSAYYHAREAATAAYRPRLELDVRFPVLGMTVDGGAVNNNGQYDFGVFENLPGEVARAWVIRNTDGEALSSLHVTSLTLTGSDAWAFALTTPDGGDFYLGQGQSTAGYAVRFDPGGAYGVFDDARIVATANDPERSPFTIYLKAAHQPGLPAVQITDPAGATNIYNEITQYRVCGVCSNAVGWMRWVNSLGGSNLFAAPAPGAPWEVLIPLHIGENTLTVSGTNEVGAVASDAVTITRESDTPVLTVTDPAGWFLAVSEASASNAVAGTVNRYVTGDIRWTGPEGAGGAFPATALWTETVPLQPGWNDFVFTASNAAGTAASAKITVVRQPAEALTPGDLTLLGWNKNPVGGPGQTFGSDFVMGTMTDIPSGTTVYITDNGCFGDGRFFGATEEQAAGMEHLGAIVFRRTVRAGRLISAFETGDNWRWVFSGRIATTSDAHYSMPRLDQYDQLYLFQSDGPNPLFRPRNHVFALDDTGRFEDPHDVQSGNIPPGLTEGETALTLPLFPPPALLYFDFDQFPEQIHTRAQWMDLFPLPEHWFLALSGLLPRGPFLIGELAVIELLAGAETNAVAFSCAYPERPYRLWSATDLVHGPPKVETIGITRPGRNTDYVPAAASSCFYWVEAEEEPFILDETPVPGGTNSGIDPDFGAYSLTVESFFMSTFPVTQSVWERVCDLAADIGYDFDGGGEGKAPDHPVQRVSWYDAVKWCNALSELHGRIPLYTVDGAVYRSGSFGSNGSHVVRCDFDGDGYRLPTIAEWQYAARGGLSGLRFPWGDTIDHDAANYLANPTVFEQFYDTAPYTEDTYHPDYDDDPVPYTNPVDAFPPNGYGLYSMAGNVFEWCWDLRDTLREYRGGSWHYWARGARCGDYYFETPDGRYNWMGFRFVRR